MDVDAGARVRSDRGPRAARREDARPQVTKTTLTAESSRLKLALYLPQPVHADKGTAKWDDKKKILTISLPVDVDDW